MHNRVHVQLFSALSRLKKDNRSAMQWLANIPLFELESPQYNQYYQRLKGDSPGLNSIDMFIVYTVNKTTMQ